MEGCVDSNIMIHRNKETQPEHWRTRKQYTTQTTRPPRSGAWFTWIVDYQCDIYQLFPYPVAISRARESWTGTGWSSLVRWRVGCVCVGECRNVLIISLQFTDDLYTKGTRAHMPRELIREWLWEPKGSSFEYIWVLRGELNSGWYQ